MIKMTHSKSIIIKFKIIIYKFYFTYNLYREATDEGEDSEMEELMKEFDRIKKLREEEKKQKEKIENEKLKEMTQEQILMGNPLLNTSYSLKKK